MQFWCNALWYSIFGLTNTANSLGIKFFGILMLSYGPISVDLNQTGFLWKSLITVFTVHLLLLVALLCGTP